VFPRYHRRYITARKGLTVIGSFVLFPGDKPFSERFALGLALFLCAIRTEPTARVDKKKT